jgi:hypothetical protein
MQYDLNCFKCLKKNKNFLKKLPSNCKAVNILVAECDFLKNSDDFLFAIVGFAEPFYLDFTEVLIPTKYLVLVLGAPGNSIKYRAISRCAATLFSDEVLINACYLAA